LKPDVILPDSRALFTNGELTAGASNSAAFFAGVVALMKAAAPGLRTRHLLWFAHYGKARNLPVGPDGMPLAGPRAPSNARMRTVTANAPMPRERLPARRTYAPSPPPASTARLTSSSNAAVSAAGTWAGQLRLWQTPTRQELLDEIRTDK
jgi:hypothetical protein